MYVEVEPALRTPTLLARVITREEVVTTNAFWDHLSQYIGTQNGPNSVFRIVGVETLLQRIQCLTVTKAELRGQGLALELQQPELQAAPSQKPLSYVTIECPPSLRGKASALVVAFPTLLMQLKQRVEVMAEICLVAAAPDADPILGFQPAAGAHQPPTLVARQSGQVGLPTRRQQNYEPWLSVGLMHPTTFFEATQYPGRRRRVGR